MAKKAVCRLTIGAALLVTLLGAAPQQATYVRIERLEMARSLGDGQLARYLHSSDRSVAIRAALAVGRTKQAAGIALLLPFARSKEVGMRAMAVYGLGLIGGSSVAAPVLGSLDDASGAVRVMALDGVNRLETAKTLSSSSEKRAVNRTLQLLESPNPTIRARAATTLNAFAKSPYAGSAASALSSAYLHEENAFVRWHEMWTLFRAYAKTVSQNVLARGLRDSNEVVRIQAVRAFGRRADASALALLQPLLQDPSWRVREQTLESIKVLRGGEMTEHLKAIPAGVQTPAPQPDPYASIAALPRTPASGKPSAPAGQNIIAHPQLDPRTVALATGPAPGPHPRVRVVTTRGNVYVELFPEWAPLTVENFLNLANRGYYDNNPWFRIVPDFVVQTGDPTGNGNGDAGYTIPAEENPIEQDSYVISMGLNYTNPPNAHAIRDSAGTQFYITLSPQLHLNSDFTVFGRVFSGADVLGRLIESDKVVRVERLPDGAP